MKTLKPGEIANYCDVHQRTVSRWIASGQLKGFKLPGRGNYRVLLGDFLAFLRQQQMPVPPVLQHQLQAPRVLVVDDEPLYRRTLRRLLQMQGYLVEEAHDGFQAGVQLTLFQPQLVTLDLSMPGLDGLAVLQYIREQQALATMQVVVISALSDDALLQATQLGAAAVFAKPFDNQQLLATLQQLLSAEWMSVSQ